MGNLHSVARAMVAHGLIAMDESTGTCEKRFSAVGLACTEETRRAYREMLLTAKDVGKYISGAILYKETLYQKTKAGKPFVQVLLDNGMVPGIKVDGGLEKQPNGEELTKGLEELKADLPAYKAAGARFAKWRAVVHIGANTPTVANVRENARRLAAYAKACQDHGIVPIVEPEVLFDGDHTLARCAEASTLALTEVFKALAAAKVDLKGVVLKPSMVLPGKDAKKSTPEKVADATVKVLLACVPPETAGIAFLSGGIEDDDCTAYLREMNARHKGLPWRLTFSFSRGLQRPALAAFAKGDVAGGQKALIARAKACYDASHGK